MYQEPWEDDDEHIGEKLDNCLISRGLMVPDQRSTDEEWLIGMRYEDEYSYYDDEYYDDEDDW